MSDVFISYSRRNADFVHQIFDALHLRKMDVWVDWEDIPKGSDWVQEILNGIEAADTFVLILSPDSLLSEVCNDEIGHAIAHHKRIIPVVYQDVDEDAIHAEWNQHEWGTLAKKNWQTVRHINWVFIRESDDFDTGFADLIETINTDLVYVKTHTRLLVRARDWEKNERNWSFLLLGEEIERALQWLAEADGDSKLAPRPAEIQRAYIDASQQQEQQRQAQLRRARWLSVAATVIALFAVGAGVFAAITTQQANSAQRDLDDARQSGTQAAQQALDFENTLVPIPATIAAAEAEIAQFGQTLTPIPATLEAASVALEQIEQQRLEVEALRAATIGEVQMANSPDHPRLAALAAIYSLKTAYSTTGDDVLQWANTRLLDQWFVPYEQSDGVSALAFSSDGTRAISAGLDGSLRVWDIATGDIVQQWTPFGDGPIFDAAISSDGQQAVAVGTQGEGVAVVYDIQTGAETGRYSDASVAFTALALYEGWVVIGDTDGVIRILDAATLDVLQRYQESFGQIREIRVHPGPTANSTYIASLDGFNSVVVWDYDAETVLSSFDEPIMSAFGNELPAAFSPDGSRVAFSTEAGFILFRSTESGIASDSITAHDTFLSSIAFSNDGQYGISLSFDGVNFMWDVANAATVAEIPAPPQLGLYAALSPDNRLALVASVDGMTLVEVPFYPHVLPQNREEIVFFRGVFSPDFSQYTVVSDNSLGYVVDVAPLARRYTLDGHGQQVVAADYSPDGSVLVTASWDNSLIFWDMETGAEIGRADNGVGVAADDDGYGDDDYGYDDEGYGYDDDYADVFDRVAFSPDGQHVASGHNSGNLKVWDVETRTLTASTDSGLTLVNDLHYTADGSLIGTSGLSDSVIFWDAETLEIQQTFTLPDGEFVSGFDISDDGEWLLIAGEDGSVTRWSMNTGEPVMTYTPSETYKGVRFIAMSPGNRWLLAWDELTGIGNVWDFETGAVVRYIRLRGLNALAMDFMSDERIIYATASGKVIQMPVNIDAHIADTCDRILGVIDEANLAAIQLLPDFDYCP